MLVFSQPVAISFEELNLSLSLLLFVVLGVKPRIL
jgi:hypothetical protein